MPHRSPNKDVVLARHKNLAQEFRPSAVGWVIAKHQSENVFQRYVGALRRRDALQGMSSDEFLNEIRGATPSSGQKEK